MKFRVIVNTTRLNPHVEVKEIIDITVKDTVVSANVIYTETINYTDSVSETKSKFGVDKKEINLFINDVVGLVNYTSEGNLPEEKEDFIFNLYDQAKITYFQ